MNLRLVLIAGAMLSPAVAHAMPVSPGFEQGPAVGTISFTPTDTDGLGWFASNTDGERIVTTVGKPAAEGNYYASLLQNSGAYDGAPLGTGNFGFTGFDRIYATFPVLSSSTYNVSFQHASDDRFNYLAGTSVVEIVDFNSNATLSQMSFATPGLFDWQTVSFQFNTGATTTTAAIAFTVMGNANASGVFDAIDVSLVPEPSAVALVAMAIAGLCFPAIRRR